MASPEYIPAGGRVHVAHILPRCTTLGPGVRTVIWVSGCSRRCPGCIAGPILSLEAGSPQTIEELASRVNSYGDAEGLTFSGGEPFEQAAALAVLCRTIRHSRPRISFLSFSGFTLEELRSTGDSSQRSFLNELDVLIDGPFIAAQSDDLLWRGSRNQRIHFLTDRYSSIEVDAPSEGVEVHVARDGSVFWAGIPEPGFEASLTVDLRKHGVTLRRTVGVWA